MLLTVINFFARFHPILVHFPVGILVLATGFIFFAHNSLKPAVQVLLFWGMLSAIFSCVSGWLLAAGEEYEGTLVDQHRWMGIATALAAALLYVLVKKQSWEKSGALLVLALVTITGHLGGSLTHGETYLKEALSNNSGSRGPVIEKLENPDTAILYNSLVQPILEARCYSCHGANKQKGKLRLDALNFMRKGGEEGIALTPGKPEESSLISRIKLPLESKDHMPPKEKAQLTTDEINILHWWVATGGSDTATIGHLQQTQGIQKIMARLATGETAETARAETLPKPEPPPADTAAINALQHAGVTVIPLARGSQWLSVSFVGAFNKDEATLALLAPIAKQVLTLRIDSYPLQAKGMEQIIACPSIRKLELPHCSLTDADMRKLAELKTLVFLNLTDNPVSLAGVQQLQSLKGLQQLYLYQTRLTGKEIDQLSEKWTGIKIDSGGYRLPMLPGDTNEIIVN